jgi:hypothetical protein
LEIARRRVNIYGFGESVRFYNGSAEALNALVPAEAFDLVYSFGVIHHLFQPPELPLAVRSAAFGSRNRLSSNLHVFFSRGHPVARKKRFSREADFHRAHFSLSGF